MARIQISKRPPKEVEARELGENEVCSDAEMLVDELGDGKRYCVLRSSIEDSE